MCFFEILDFTSHTHVFFVWCESSKVNTSVIANDGGKICFVSSAQLRSSAAWTMPNEVHFNLKLRSLREERQY